MAKIPDEEIDRFKCEVELSALVRGRGIELRQHGANLIGLCPFHDDRDPSLVVTPAKNLWNCLGACQTGGSVIDWVMKSEGVSFRHAVELLRERGGAIGAGRPIEPVKKSTVTLLPSPISEDGDDPTMLRQVARYYHETLKASADALRYLEHRGIRSDEAIDRFRLGYADRSLGLRLPNKQRRAGADIRERLQGLGLMRESGHEHFNGCLTIPIIDRSGEISGMYGRKINDNLRPGTAYHLYLPGPHRGVWNLDALTESKEIILCEALIDALTFWCAGLRNVTTAYGVNGFTDEMFEAMKTCGTRRVYIAYDRDEAGDRAAVDLAQRLAGENIGAFRVMFPHGMDANEFARKVTPASHSLTLLVKSAGWIAGPAKSSIVVASVAPSLAAVAAERSSAAAPATGEPIDITLGDRRYRVRGLEKNLTFEQMKIVLRVERAGADFLDSVDLVSARQRLAYVKQASIETGVKEEILRGDLAKVRGTLEPIQEAIIKQTLEPQSKREVVIPPDEHHAAMNLYRDPNLIARIVEDFDRCGFVGERTNKLMAYLAAISRNDSLARTSARSA